MLTQPNLKCEYCSEVQTMVACEVIIVERKDEAEQGGLQYHDINTTEKLLRHAQQLATTIASQASLVKSFVGKWIIITSRLLQLPALLMEMSRLRCLSDNTVCKDLLQVILVLSMASFMAFIKPLENFLYI